MPEPMKRVFGIDLGTTYSSIAYMDDFGRPVVVANSENEDITPSVVFFDGEDVLVGATAKENAKLSPQDVVCFIKRSMGEADFLFPHEDELLRAEEISAYILKKLVKDTESILGEQVEDVVITCPAYFGINEREATKLAGEIAGLNVLRIINEPTAAAIAYGLLDTTNTNVVLVYDLGGGTFDITMIDISTDSVRAICTGGDHNLGGKDWDDRIVAYLAEEFQNKTGLSEDILDDPDVCQNLMLLAEKAKMILSRKETASLTLTHKGHRETLELTREKFEQLTQDLLERTVNLTREMLAEAKKKGFDEFNEIILVGGSTRMPQVVPRLKSEFNVEPRMFDPVKAVAKGAAIYGWKLSVNENLMRRLNRKTGQDLGSFADVRKMDNQQVEEAAREVADETGYTLPAVLKSMVAIKDIASKSFGIEAETNEGDKGVFNLIMRNSRVPVKSMRTFYTAVPNQKQVDIRIMESETREKWFPAHEAMEIGTAVLHLPAGLPRDTPVEIAFTLNREGRLNLTAIEASEGQRVDVTLETAHVISGEELEKAIERTQAIKIK